MKTGIMYNPFVDDSYNRFGVEKFKKIKEFGFDAIDYNLSDTNTPIYSFTDRELKSFTDKENELLLKADITISQVHGPWRWPPQDAAKEDRAERFEKMSKSLQITKMLGCKYWVIHPLMPFGIEDKGTGHEEETWQINLEFMKEILAVAKELDIIICLENMPMPKFSIGSPEEILKFVDEICDEHFMICFDTGHAEICNQKYSVGDAVRLLKDKIKVLHVHDNKHGEDLHLMPFQGTIDWSDFSKALYEIKFDGVFSLEMGAPNKLNIPLFEEMNVFLGKIAKELA